MIMIDYRSVLISYRTPLFLHLSSISPPPFLSVQQKPFRWKSLIPKHSEGKVEEEEEEEEEKERGGGGGKEKVKNDEESGASLGSPCNRLSRQISAGSEST